MVENLFNLLCTGNKLSGYANFFSLKNYKKQKTKNKPNPNNFNFEIYFFNILSFQFSVKMMIRLLLFIENARSLGSRSLVYVGE